MLEFIVLGQIPGTDIYLPFGVVAPALVVLFAGAALYRVNSPLRSYKKQIEKIFDISL